jgi:phosphoglucomutase/phosphomannomutase
MYPIGTNVMNERTVGESAQGLADYLHRELKGAPKLSCVIAHDTRNHSAEFARLSASVLAGNGVQVFMFSGERSTPQLSFAVRDLHASAGIVISASHNPPSDNGFKCYWETGGQVLPPHDVGIIQCVETVREIRSLEFEHGVREGTIRILGPEHDRAYIEAVARQSLSRRREMRIVYTPLHGVGMTSVARVLEHVGFGDLHMVQSQAVPDGNFPHVAGQSPNPEQPVALREAIALAQSKGADLVLASDPDADRIGAAVPDPDGGDWIPLTGNQIAALLAHFVITQRVAAAKPAEQPAPGKEGRPFIVKTLVTTELITRIADAHGLVTWGDLPVGFKWIAEVIDQHGPDRFLFGAEESHGYLAGTYARDKDAAVAALLLAELAAELKASQRSVLGHLNELYRTYGFHIERTVSKSRPGRAGAVEIAQIMTQLRTRPPRTLADMNVVRVHDFVDGVVRPIPAAEPTPLQAMRQPQVMLELDQAGWRVVGRPSGTEPKIKFYLFGVVPREQLRSDSDLAQAKRRAAAVMERLSADIEAFGG